MRQVRSILAEDPRLEGEKVDLVEQDFLEGTLYYLKQVEKVRKVFEVNTRASSIVQLPIHGDAIIVFRSVLILLS
jgi:hypothetical protein